jgi:guanylate kinase
VFLLSGPAEVGTDTLLRRASAPLRHIRAAVSVTTRPPRSAEINGIDYFFISPTEFSRMEAADELLEHATVRGMRYGTSRRWLMEQTLAGVDVVLQLDIPQAQAVKSRCAQAVLIFLAPPCGRNARREWPGVVQYDYLIINEQLDEAADSLRAVILAEREKNLGF